MTRTPCERRPALFDLAPDGLGGFQPAPVIEHAQYLCVRWCPKLRGCRADSRRARPDHVWAGLIVGRSGARFETVEEWYPHRLETTASSSPRQAPPKPRDPIISLTHCAECGAELAKRQRRYCSTTCSSRHNERTRTPRVRRGVERVTRHADYVTATAEDLTNGLRLWRDAPPKARHQAVAELHARGMGDDAIAERILGAGVGAVYNVRRRILKLQANESR